MRVCAYVRVREGTQFVGHWRMADITGINELQVAFQQLGRTTGANIHRALARCGAFAMREAKDNAPKSATMKQLSATLKRKKRTSRKMMPGGLEKSIEYEILPGDAGCSVFVASNSFAAKYARRIHDEKGKTWRNRGPGTVAKGARADEKFIERAIKDNVDKYTAIFKDEIGKAKL